MTSEIESIRLELENGKLVRESAYEVINQRVEDALDKVSFEFMKALEFGLITGQEVKAIGERVQELRAFQNTMKYRV